MVNLAALWLMVLKKRTYVASDYDPTLDDWAKAIAKSKGKSASYKVLARSLREN